MMTEFLNGYFDVRRYQKDTMKEKQPLKADNEIITFDVRFDELPGQFKAYAKERTFMPSGGAKPVTYHRVSFKISGRAKWYDENARPIARPTNADLDGRRFCCRMTYRQLDGDPNAHEACGYWVNDIQMKAPEAVNPFALPDVDTINAQQAAVQGLPTDTADNVQLAF